MGNRPKTLKEVINDSIGKYTKMFTDHVLSSGSTNDEKTRLILEFKKTLEEIKTTCEERKRY